MANELTNPVDSGFVLSLLDDAAVHPLDAGPFDAEREEVARLCEISMALGLVWASYVLEWFAVRARTKCRSDGDLEKAVDHAATSGDREPVPGFYVEPTWLQIVHGSCRSVWHTLARAGVAVPGLPACGELMQGCD